MPISKDQLGNLVASNGDVIGRSGEKIGGIGTIYLDDISGEPEWVTVKAGLFGASESFVPLSGARIAGNDIHVGYEKETVKDAPRVDANGNLSPEEEQQLYAHYGLSGTQSTGYRPVMWTTTPGSRLLSPPDTRRVMLATTPGSRVLSPPGTR